MPWMPVWKLVIAGSFGLLVGLI